MDFLEDAYLYDAIGYEEDEKDVFKYRFRSLGDKEEDTIIKIVSIAPLFSSHDVYNLGFGNLEVDENGNDIVNENPSRNNDDSKRVLSTVFLCLIDYLLSVNSKAEVLFFGNTVTKNNLYKRKIGLNLDELNTEFAILGGILKEKIPTKVVEVEKWFKGKKRIKKEYVKDIDSIIDILRDYEKYNQKREDYKHLEIFEPFNVEHTYSYDFTLLNKR